MWCGTVQPAGNLGGESPAVFMPVRECGSWELPQGTVLGDKTHQEQTHISCKNQKKKCCDRWSKYLCFPHLCAKSKPLVPAPTQVHVSHGCLEASRHIRPRKCSTTLGYLGTETKPWYSTAAELCVSELLPLALLAISWPGRETYLWVCVGFFAMELPYHIAALRLGAAGRDRSHGATQCWESFAPSRD